MSLKVEISKMCPSFPERKIERKKNQRKILSGESMEKPGNRMVPRLDRSQCQPGTLQLLSREHSRATRTNSYFTCTLEKLGLTLVGGAPRRVMAYFTNTDHDTGFRINRISKYRCKNLTSRSRTKLVHNSYELVRNCQQLCQH